jgi:protocatechuate 3,4-dioxygenase alpha subunit
LQAPHVNVSLLGRGLLNRLPTRIYFADDPANATDPVLLLVPEDRRATLLAHPDTNLQGGWRFDIHLSGPRETVFFDV